MPAAKGWRVEGKGDYIAFLVSGKPVNHKRHAVLSLLTGGLWLPVWAGISLFGGREDECSSGWTSGGTCTDRKHGSSPLGAEVALYCRTAINQGKESSPMHWTGNGRIEVSRNFALGVAAVIIALALAAMFLIGMVIGQDGEERIPRPKSTPHPASWPPSRRRKRPRRPPRPTGQQEEPETPTRPQDRHENGILHLPGQDPQVPAAGRGKRPGSPRGPTTATTVRCGT